MSQPVLQVLQRTVRQPPPPAVLVRRPGQLRLRITGGSAAPRAETFVKDRIACGRSVVNDIALDDPLLSGTHFSLELVQDGVRLVDRGSTNGTWFCGGRVSELCLSAGMSFTAGGYRFEILGTDSVEVPVLTASEFYGMHGKSAVMREVFARLARLAETDLDLFVEGETGTGKEMVAPALHAASPRAEMPFVVLDCAWWTRNLAEEIFGHAKGAYTQAHEAAPGCFEEASGGTLFIDEIGELLMDLQPRLLRVLDREVQRLGERKLRKVDVRVADGQFREDLYFRLIEENLQLPPLRERDGDANHLAEVMLAKLSQEHHGWPGNVRELYKVLRRASRLVQSPEISPGDLRLSSVEASERRTGCFELPFSEAVPAFETEYFKRLMVDAGGNVSEAARRSGFSRRALRERLKRHGVYEGHQRMGRRGKLTSGTSAMDEIKRHIHLCVSSQLASRLSTSTRQAF